MSNQLRVLYYNTFLNKQRGGEGLVSRHFLKAAQRLDEWEIVPVPPSSVTRLPDNGAVPRVKRRMRSRIKPLFPASLRRSLRSFLSSRSRYPLGPYLYRRRMKGQFEAVWQENGPFDVMLWHLSQGDLETMVRLCDRIELPLVLRAPGPFAYQADHVFNRYMSRRDRANERLLYERADAICVISEHMKQLMIREAGVDPDKVYSIPNGIDFDHFDPRQVDNTDIRQRFGLKGRPVVGYLGGFWPGNDLETLLRAWQGVETAVNEAVLFLVGDGPGRKQAEQLSRELNLQHCLWAGHVPHADVPRYISAMDIGIGPYTEAALEFVSPLKVMEYIAMGVAVVATHGGQLTELIQEGRTGCTYEAGSVSQLRQHLLSLLAAPGKTAEMGRQAREDSLDWYSWKNVASEVAAVCQKVVR